MYKFHLPSINNMKGQDSMSPLPSMSLIKIVSNEKYLDESRNVKFKCAIIKMIKEFRGLKRRLKISELSLIIYKYTDK